MGRDPTPVRRWHLGNVDDLSGVLLDILQDENACLSIDLHGHAFPHADRVSLLIGECP